MFYVEQRLDQINVLKDHLSNNMGNELEEARMEMRPVRKLSL